MAYGPVQWPEPTGSTLPLYRTWNIGFRSSRFRVWVSELGLSASAPICISTECTFLLLWFCYRSRVSWAMMLWCHAAIGAVSTEQWCCGVMLLLDIRHSLCNSETQQEMLCARRNYLHQCWDCQQQPDGHYQNTSSNKTGLLNSCNSSYTNPCTETFV